jgi:hypothetical protein
LVWSKGFFIKLKNSDENKIPHYGGLIKFYDGDRIIGEAGSVIKYNCGKCKRPSIFIKDLLQ